MSVDHAQPRAKPRSFRHGVSVWDQRLGLEAKADAHSRAVVSPVIPAPTFFPPAVFFPPAMFLPPSAFSPAVVVTPPGAIVSPITVPVAAVVVSVVSIRVAVTAIARLRRRRGNQQATSFPLSQCGKWVACFLKLRDHANELPRPTAIVRARTARSDITERKSDTVIHVNQLPANSLTFWTANLPAAYQMLSLRSYPNAVNLYGARKLAMVNH